MFLLHDCNYNKVVLSVSNLLADRSMNQSELARALGVSRSLISKKMNGDTAFTLRDILALADLFHVNVDEVLGREPMEAQ
ncbi:helix-turn-helix transcriptional regulator [Bifidobacterium sp. ESL0820]|uniref:helix-turn-helix transcriptional regulator n=1 Tax=Bifidobacterium sp. ESL0820 TaxID=3448586 RepID=UPI004041F618